MNSYSIFLSLFHFTWHPRDPSMLLQMAGFPSFYGWILFHCIQAPHLPYPFICWWTLPCLGFVTKALFLRRCLFASFLTIALQTKLVYLTSILEVLTRDLMEQCSNMQPKLMLRRTESVVEKLLTNWMSVCLSGFLRVSVASLGSVRRR